MEAPLRYFDVKPIFAAIFLIIFIGPGKYFISACNASDSTEIGLAIRSDYGDMLHCFFGKDTEVLMSKSTHHNVYFALS